LVTFCHMPSNDGHRYGALCEDITAEMPARGA
jgi:hypothetical protein